MDRTSYKATWRTVCNPIDLRLWDILTRHRELREIANIEKLLTRCPNPSEALTQWARANVPNMAIGSDLMRELGPDDPKVREHRAALRRKNRGKYNHLRWP